uniref:Integrase_H2C2 domain-containing protein n=1 Tax=Loa loa TaxID=7209 RepID=A0A1I7VP52_LOALO
QYCVVFVTLPLTSKESTLAFAHNVRHTHIIYIKLGAANTPSNLNSPLQLTCRKFPACSNYRKYFNKNPRQSPKTVAATVADDSIRETYMVCKEVRLLNPDEPRKIAEALIFFDTGYQKGRSTVKRVINGCFVCRRWRTKPYKLPLMPNLPETRVKRSKPFEQVSLDYMALLPSNITMGSLRDG